MQATCPFAFQTTPGFYRALGGSCTGWSRHEQDTSSGLEYDAVHNSTLLQQHNHSCEVSTQFSSAKSIAFVQHNTTHQLK